MNRRDFISSSMALSGAMSMPGILSTATANQASSLRILVLGGTNFVGPAIVEDAVARGHEVTLFNRGITRPELFSGIEKLHGLRSLEGSNLRTLSGKRRWDAVIDVWPEHSALVDETATLLAERVDYYHFVSSIAVYRDFSKPGMDESAALRRGEPGYGGEKVAAESIVADLYADRFGVARCHAIFGPRDPGSTLHYWLRRFATYDSVAAPANGEDAVQFVDVRDVARWTVDCIENKRVGIYNLAAPSITFRDFLATCRSVVNSDSETIWIDPEVIAAQRIRSFDQIPLWIPEHEDPGFFRISSARSIDAGLNYQPASDTTAAAWRWYQSVFFKDTQFPHNGWGISRDREDALIDAWLTRKNG